MTIARSKLVDVSVSRWYHCISRCVRRAYLFGENQSNCNRKAWIENRLQELDQIFAISVGGFAVMGNHLHVLLRLDPGTSTDWSSEEVVRRWHLLFPPRGTDRKPLTAAKLKQLAVDRAKDKSWVRTHRDRLTSLGWFMKCLKEPLSRMANKEEKCTGTFFEGRFKSIAILDDESLLAVCAYIDLNPVAAGVAKLPEDSPHTSIKQRVDNVRKQGREKDLCEAKHGSVQATRRSARLEETLWLVPIEDRRQLDSRREGMLESFTLGNYLKLVEHTGRMLRDGKVSISDEVVDIFERLDSSAEVWESRIRKLVTSRNLGRFMAASRRKLKDAATKLGFHHVANLCGIRAT